MLYISEEGIAETVHPSHQIPKVSGVKGALFLLPGIS